MRKALLKFDILVASFFINFLALAVPLYVIQALTRFLSNGVNETLYALTIGVLIAWIGGMIAAIIPFLLGRKWLNPYAQKLLPCFSLFIAFTSFFNSTNL